MIALQILAVSKRDVTSNLTLEKNKGENGLVANSSIAHSRNQQTMFP